MTEDNWYEIGSSVCLVIGAVLSLAAGIGLLRFPDALSRMHAATKPQIAGLAFILLAVGLEARNWATISTLILVMLFQMLTAPVAAHMIGRAAYRTRHLRRELLLTDELADVVDRASQDLTTDPAKRPER
ncbi:monovalent cation/H(+) antiporter subunit G [Agreia sp. COWG]|uniref:monovalent cation/H(+) antiporter subunit G n=1 Tax=Agreia sp. COWG TaxID=2773266 RepID=UPI001927A6F7|nr:monovalent cation/H(+) antiporter subunit G [Agreia sp. COWG]CAD6007304.1 Na(+) H(+) antiporter subunit G [Agreia sp. COWG]